MVLTDMAGFDTTGAEPPLGMAEDAADAGEEVAAVGPVVADALAKHGVRVRLMPADSFFMKPLATAMEAELGQRAQD